MLLFRLAYIALSIIFDLLVIALYGLIILFHPTSTTTITSYQPDKYQNESRSVIFLIHGSGSSDRQFILARYILQGYPVETINLSKGDRTIDQYSQEVCDAIQVMRIKSVMLAGVSMGGLVASYYANFLKPPEVEVIGIVTIGSPFQGAPLLKFAPDFLLPVRHKQMSPRYMFIDTLNGKMRQRHLKYQFHYLTIGSQSDLHVPDEYSYPSASLPYHTHMTLRAPGHIALTVHPCIFLKIKSFYLVRLNNDTYCN